MFKTKKPRPHAFEMASTLFVAVELEEPSYALGAIAAQAVKRLMNCF